MEASIVLYLIKLIFFSVIYGCIISFLIHYSLKKTTIKLRRTATRFMATLICFVTLLIYAVFFNGYRGMGLFKVLHINNDKVIKQDRMRGADMDGEGIVYIEPSNVFYEIGKFKIDNGVLHAELIEDNQISNQIIHWNTENDTVLFSSKKSNTLKLNKNFSEYYEEYWNGWRLWLLP